MTLTAIILLLISTITHVGWNLLGKREHPTSAFLLVANTLGTLCLAPVLIRYGRVLADFSPRVWMLLMLTGICQAAYYAALAGAYRSGDMSLAYPLARSLPAVFVAILTQLIGQGERLTGQAILGIGLIVAGSFVLPMTRFGDFQWKNYFQLSTLLALGAALGTTGYSTIDDEALRLLRETIDPTIGHAAVTTLYSFCEGISTSLWLAVFVLMYKPERTSLRQILRTRMRVAAITGASICLGYNLVLIAMAYVSNVSYVVAFRQISVPLGVLLGVIILKEARHAPKFVGVAIMFVGLVLVGTG